MLSNATIVFISLKFTVIKSLLLKWGHQNLENEIQKTNCVNKSDSNSDVVWKVIQNFLSHYAIPSLHHICVGCDCLLMRVINPEKKNASEKDQRTSFESVLLFIVNN